MPNIVKVNKKDKLRTLLTDVLPYELPLWYTNYQMHTAFTEKLEYYETISGLRSNSRADDLIAHDYKVFRGETKAPRNLSIVHPFAQIRVCDFYRDYDDLIEYYCGKSKKSLRYPYKKATKFYGKLNKDEEGRDGVEMVQDDRPTASSYFKYLKYPFLYRFFESYEYHKLEKRFNNMMQVDISKCFPSIYTHTIGWATKTKRIAKNKQNGAFDGDFDNLMQNLNYRETNGIVIGPEVSRIFSEIILQQIDVDIIVALSEKHDLKDGVHYDFRRYVDDYFVFYRDDQVGKKVFSEISNSLQEYKLHLNEAKTIYAKRPFTTQISLAKDGLRSTVKSIYFNRFDKEGELRKVNSPYREANQVISKLKNTIASYNVEYQSISNYLISALEKKLKSFFYKLSSVESIEEFHVNWLLVDLDVIFFVHAMDIRIRTTDKLAKLINYVLSHTTSFEKSYKDIVDKKIFDQVRQAIDIFIDAKGEIYGLETLNLLVILTLLPDQYKLDETILKKYYGSVKDGSGNQDLYFRWVTFMLYVKDDSDFSDMKIELILEAKEALLSDLDGFKSSQYFLLYFDFMACPEIPKAVREELVGKIKTKYGINFNQIKVDYILKNEFVVPWKDKNYLQNTLSKREFTFAYD
jgi:hypothetical protein